CELGLPDALTAAKTPEELAAAGYGSAPLLSRLLRSLAAYDVVKRRRDGRYTLAHAGLALTGRSSVAPMIRYANAPWHAAAYHRLADAIRNGADGFTLAYERPLFAYLAQQPAASNLFDGAMNALGELYAEPFARAYDFSTVRTVVDVGGGTGALLAAVRERYPAMQATVYELPHVVRAAPPRSGIAFVEGDIVTQPPPPADCYILSHVLHDWDDDRAGAILRNVRAAMSERARLLIFELVAAEDGNVWTPDRLTDVEMLTMLGGKERTREAFAALLERSGLTLLAVHPAGVPEAVIECAPAGIPNR
ncbi:MAG TPA: methyltransferase, partial [Candidatus Baltobacteraceae bacterium]|nr:methyltransferase [Candidatus Baltobacteraceae bacterium]